LTETYIVEKVKEMPGDIVTDHQLSPACPRTLKAKYEDQDDYITHPRAILCRAKNAKEIYYQFEDELVTSEAAVVYVPSPALSAPIAVSARSGPITSIEDVPIKASDILNVIVAQKLKKKVPLSKSIKDLVGGKSTLQNEILGDLQMEFMSAPEKGEELPL
jgi:fatty acid synthase subunit alpha, fungi type